MSYIASDLTRVVKEVISVSSPLCQITRLTKRLLPATLPVLTGKKSMVVAEVWSCIGVGCLCAYYRAGEGSGNPCLCQFLCWHTGNGEALPTTDLTDAIDNVVHQALVLAIHALSSLALGALSIQDAGGAISVVDLNAVGALEHWVSLDYLVIILPPSGGLGRTVPPPPLAHQKYQSTTNHITFLLLPVLQFHVVDTNTPNFPLVFYNNTIFRIGAAGNHGSIGRRGSIHAKEFLYTTPCPCWYPVLQ